MAAGLPFEIREAIVQVCGKSFWLKDPFRAFFISAGVPPEMLHQTSSSSMGQTFPSFWKGRFP